MRLATAWILVLVAIASARADEVTFRGNYYRDRNTRVIQPEVLFQKELPNGILVGGHYLLDTITSASIAAGVVRDQPFTELRNEFGLVLGKRLGPAALSASYSFSQESDYRAQQATLSGVIDLFQRNTTLGLALAYNHDNAFQRMGAATFIPVGALDSLHLIASATQVITKTALATLSYDADVVGFGDVNNGYQANPYRPANVGGMPQRELVPFQRVRNAVSGALSLTFPIDSPRVPFFALRESYRFYWDDWGLTSHTGELRSTLPVGPFEIRTTGRFYTQNHVSFWSEIDGKPAYVGNTGLACTTCFLGSSKSNHFATADPKLGTFDTYYFELRFAWRMSALARLWFWLSEGRAEISYGHLFNSSYAHTAFGDADLAALSLTFPL